MEGTVAALFLRQARRHPERAALLSRDPSGGFRPTPYRELAQRVEFCALGLLAWGVRRGEAVGLVSENRPEWLVADLALLSIGAADVPRGCAAPPGELAGILRDCGCRTVFVENLEQAAKVQALREGLPALARLVVLDGGLTGAVPAGAAGPRAPGPEVQPFEALLAAGERARARHPRLFERVVRRGRPEDLATILFTSGTAGEPRGVKLAHRSLVHQVVSIEERVLFHQGEDIWLSVLPVWHAFERIMQYAAVGTGTTIAYSRPNGRVMLEDFARLRPTWLASVPRLWETVRAGIIRRAAAAGPARRTAFRLAMGVGHAWAWSAALLLGRLPCLRPRPRPVEVLLAAGPLALLAPLRLAAEVLVFRQVKAALGGRFAAGICGGSALPARVDWFFAAIGIRLLEGYGLTEAAPVLCVRLQRHPVLRTVGPPIPGTELRIVDGEGRSLPAGRQGRILARGPQVMLGYWRRPQETARVLSPDGWLDTGDLGLLTRRGELCLTGRAKDTIVLRGGENVEPAPLEARLRESPYIAQAVVLGQDCKFLAALLVLDGEAAACYAAENRLAVFEKATGGPAPAAPGAAEALARHPAIVRLVEAEVRRLAGAGSDLRPHERVCRFRLLGRPFEVGRELSLKEEVRRHEVQRLYARQIAALYR